MHHAYFQMNNSYKDEVIQTIKYGKRDYTSLYPLGKNPTPICNPTVVTNNRSYGPLPEFVWNEPETPCEFGWEVEVPKNKNFNDWFNAEHFVWAEDWSNHYENSSPGFEPVAIAGFHSEVKPV